MKITSFEPKKGMDSIRHRQDRSFVAECAIIAGRNRKLFNPVTLRMYRSNGVVSFTLQIDDQTVHASGSAICQNSFLAIDYALRKTLETSGFEVEGFLEDDMCYISMFMEAVARTIGEYLKVRQEWVNYYIHSVHV